jgi:sugar (pentulose or hexulose) kinase
MTSPFFLGIDIGTQGARVVLIDVTGNVIASAGEEFPLSSQSREEQSPHQWWEACTRSLQKVIGHAKTFVDIRLVRAVSVTSTSGTVIPLDKNNEPLHNAIMYSDQRSAEEGKLCRQIAMEYNKDGYTGFNSSSGLSKMVWFVNNFPGKAAAIHKWVHAADFIIGKLSGQWGITDHTNVLKSGYDLQRNEWPEYLYKTLPLKKTWLPQVVPSGTPVGTMMPSLADQLGLDMNTQVVVGITDGCASQIASGAVNPGEWNTTIGTTLVIKGVTRCIIKDAEGTLYNHRHPEGYWMPGGASNIGADWVSEEFKNDIDILNKEADRLIPTGKMAYPLQQQGERFPFVAPGAKGFEPGGLSRAELFAANMEGVAYIERYAYEMIGKLSGEQLSAVYTAGGASNSDTWLKIRSNVLNVPIYKMKHVTGGVGAAILAASKTYFNSIIDAAGTLTQVEKEIKPEVLLAAQYEKNYLAFIRLLQEKGYIKNEAYA